MSKNSPIKFQYSQGIQSLIPIIYAAWSDRTLTPTEIAALSAMVRKLPFLTEEDLYILKNWSQPSHPPTEELFKSWEQQIRAAIPQFPEGEHPTLTEIGLRMANWADPDAAQMYSRALQSIEEGLGQVSINTYRQMMPGYAQEMDWVGERLQAHFPVSEMTAWLDKSYPEMRAKTRVLLNDSAFALKELPIKEAYREQVLRWCKLFAEQGLGALGYPKAFGGADSMGQYAAMFEILGYHDLSFAIKFGVQFGLFGGSVYWLGTEYHHQKYLPEIASLTLPGCFAMTETGHGSNVRGLETTATYDGDTQEFVIHSPNLEAGKEYIGNALHGRMASVFCQLLVGGENHGVHAILVPLRDENGKSLPGVHVEDCGYKMGLNGIDNGRIWFNQVRVPRENLLNRFGHVNESGEYSSPISDPSRRFFTMLGTLVGGRVCVPKAGLSAAKKGLAIAIKHGLKRRQFSKSPQDIETLLLDYPSHQRRLMPLLAKSYAVHIALTYLGERYEHRSDDDIREIESLAAGLKAYATWFTTQALQECREACGGKGFLAENQIPALKADTDIFTTFEGDNTVLMQLVAKGILSDFKQAFHKEGTRAVLRHVVGRWTVDFSEKNPYTIRRNDSEHLRSSEFQLAAFRYRQDRLLYSLANRIRSLIKAGENSFDAFGICQTHALALAEAYIEHLVLTQFIQEVDNSPKSLQPILKTLCDTYALHTLEKHAGWYLEQEYMLGVKTKAIRREVDLLCQELRQDALVLVDAFDIPDNCLTAPIAKM